MIDCARIGATFVAKTQGSVLSSAGLAPAVPISAILFGSSAKSGVLSLARTGFWRVFRAPRWLDSCPKFGPKEGSLEDTWKGFWSAASCANRVDVSGQALGCSWWSARLRSRVGGASVGQRCSIPFGAWCSGRGLSSRRRITPARTSSRERPVSQKLAKNSPDAFLVFGVHMCREFAIELFHIRSLHGYVSLDTGRIRSVGICRHLV